MLTTRFLALLPHENHDPRFAGDIADSATKLGFTLVREEPYVFGIVPLKASRPEQPSPGLVADVVPAAVHWAPTGAGWPGGQTLEDAERFATAKLQVFNLIEHSDDSFRLISDTLGLKHYFTAELENGVLIASSLRDMEAVCPGLLYGLDPMAVLEVFLFDSPYGDRTLHRRVRRPHAGTRIEWRRGSRWRQIRDRRLRLPQVDPTPSINLAMDRVQEPYEQTIRDFLDGDTGGVLLPLTGGFDSRLIACTLAKMEVRVDALSLGFAYHDEIQLARRTAAVLGLPYRLRPPTRDYETTVNHAIELFEGQTGTGTTFITNLLDDDSPTGTRLLHGFIGDAASGAHLTWAPAEKCSTLDDAADSAVRQLTAGLSQDFPKLLGLDVSFEDVAAQIRADFSEEGLPYQAVMLWDFENRQRRHIGPQLLYTGQKYRTCAPSYSVPVLQAWLQLPRCLLDGRSLLRQLFESRYPDVACLPHSDENKLMIPRHREAWTYFGRLLGRKVVGKVRSRMGFPLDTTRTVSWTTWLGTTDEQRAREQNGLTEMAPALERQFGYSMPETDRNFRQRLTQAPRRQDIFLRRAFILAAYAASFERSR
jgi:hypothetical protein